MSLVDRLARAPKGRGHSCTVGFALVKLRQVGPTDDPTGEFMALVNALVDPEWHATQIAKGLIEEGYSVSPRHVQQHRRGECTTANCSDPNTGSILRPGTTP